MPDTTMVLRGRTPPELCEVGHHYSFEQPNTTTAWVHRFARLDTTIELQGQATLYVCEIGHHYSFPRSDPTIALRDWTPL